MSRNDSPPTFLQLHCNLFYREKIGVRLLTFCLGFRYWLFTDITSKIYFFIATSGHFLNKCSSNLYSLFYSDLEITLLQNMCCSLHIQGLKQGTNASLLLLPFFHLTSLETPRAKANQCPLCVRPFLWL